MPKRGAIATVLTGFALILLLNFKTPSQQGVVLPGTGAVFGAAPSSATAGAAASSSAPAGSTSGGGASAAPSAGASSGPSSASGGSGASQSSSSSGSTQGASSGSGTAQSAPAATPTPASKTAAYSGQVTSPVVQTPYGPVQIQVTFSSGKMTDVKALQMPTSHFQSLQISNYVAPILRQQALQVQSAQINGVSGATYTSIGYAESLQAAIDQAHA